MESEPAMTCDCSFSYECSKLLMSRLYSYMHRARCYLVYMDPASSSLVDSTTMLEPGNTQHLRPEIASALSLVQDEHLLCMMTLCNADSNAFCRQGYLPTSSVDSRKVRDSEHAN